MILWLDNSFLSDTLLSPRPQNAAVESKFMKGSWKKLFSVTVPTSSGSCTSGSVSSKTERDISPLIMRMCMTAWFKERQWDRLYFHHHRHQRHRKAPLQRQWGRRSLVLLTRCKKKWSGVSKTPLKNDNILPQIVVELEALCGTLYLYKQSKMEHSATFSIFSVSQTLFSKQETYLSKQQMCNIFFFPLYSWRCLSRCGNGWKSSQKHSISCNLW